MVLKGTIWLETHPYREKGGHCITIFVYGVTYTLRISLTSFLWDMGKENSPRCDAANAAYNLGLLCLLLRVTLTRKSKTFNYMF